MKGWRTLLVNGLSVVLILFGWEGITQYVSPEVVALALGIVNLLLRFVTSSPVFTK